MAAGSVLLDAQIGVNGPIRISFPAQIDPSSAVSSLSLMPAIPFHIEINGQNLMVWPDQVLDTGETILITLDLELTGYDRFFTDQTQSWTVTVREPQVASLSDPINNPEIQISSLDGTTQQITSTGGRVIDFSPSFSGNEIVYAAHNDNAGSDIWLWSRGDNGSRLIFPCGEDACTNPIISPDGNSIIFLHPDAMGNSVLWRINLQNGESGQLISSSSFSASNLVWSPGGQYISFFNISLGVLQIMDVTSNDIFTLPSSEFEVGSWLPDNRHFAFSGQVFAESMVYTQIYLADLETGSVELILGDNPQTLEYGVPTWAPDGERLVISLRTMLQYGNNQLWVMLPDGSGAQVIANDPLYYYGAYQWSPDGEAVVFQQFNTPNSDSTPQLMIWDVETGESRVLTLNAALPLWLP